MKLVLENIDSWGSYGLKVLETLKRNKEISGKFACSEFRV